MDACMWCGVVVGKRERGWVVVVAPLHAEPHRGCFSRLRTGETAQALPACLPACLHACLCPMCHLLKPCSLQPALITSFCQANMATRTPPTHARRHLIGWSERSGASHRRQRAPCPPPVPAPLLALARQLHPAPAATRS
jgi:hypothetical protein